jgi:crotonobetainyl-CoA:carnitine CoA-transferase CaiB-like acyl-CoA transferase
MRTALLADMGAEVIKVEPLMHGDRAWLNPPYDGGELPPWRARRYR